MKPRYLNCYVNHNNILTENKKKVEVLELILPDDEEILNEWAAHFRHNYCNEEEIDMLRCGYGFSRSEYLLKIKFPDKSEAFGPATRSGDFTELLLADYIEYVLNYYVPRTRYDRKITRNSSSQGSDLMAFKIDKHESINDELLIYEVKGQASETPPKNQLQDAINDSKKDIKRIAESLNAVNQKLIDKRDFSGAKVIQRFQNSTDRPYRRKYGAAAIHSKYSFSEDKIKECSTADHPSSDIELIVIYKEKLMDRIHDIYRRATQC